MLERIYKSHFNNDGKVPYKVFIQIMDESLRKEDYMEHNSSLTGYRTVVKMYQERIEALFNQAYKK